MRLPALLLLAVLSWGCDTEGEKPGQEQESPQPRTAERAAPMGEVRAMGAAVPVAAPRAVSVGGALPFAPSADVVAAGASASAPLPVEFASAQPAASAPSPSTSSDTSTPTPTPSASLSAADNAKLRRRYGPADMKYNPCVKVVGTTIQGRRCPATILIYGPYAAVPANSALEFSFVLEGPTMLGVYSDMSAQAGARSLGALLPETLAAGEKRRLGYRINMATADVAVEARIWLHATGPVDFDITNLSLVVR